MPLQDVSSAISKNRNAFMQGPDPARGAIYGGKNIEQVLCTIQVLCLIELPQVDFENAKASDSQELSNLAET